MVFFLICVTGLFVLIETALLTVRRTRIEQLVDEGNTRAKLVARLLSEPTRMLATLQIGVTLVQLFSAGEAARQFVTPVAALLRAALAIGFIQRYADGLALIAVVLIVALASLIIGEITPKSIAIRHAERISLVSARAVLMLQVAASPLVFIISQASGLLVRPLGGTPTFHASAMSQEEIKLMVEHSEEHGVIDTDEKEMIHKVFEFGDIVVRKVMTPRLEVVAIDVSANLQEFIRVVGLSGHSRLPVYQDGLDNMVGIVHVKDVLAAMGSDKAPANLRPLLRRPLLIPENRRVDDLLSELRRTKVQMAVVRDEYGAVAGVVTMEDLLEEIVGEIHDEYDREVEPNIVPIDANSSVVDGRLPVEDFNQRMNLELPMEEADTVGGFVFWAAGHLPAADERVEWEGLTFTVKETDGRRVLKVLVERKASPPEAARMQPDEEPDSPD